MLIKVTPFVQPLVSLPMRLDMRGTARPSRAPRKPPSCTRILRFFTIEILGGLHLSVVSCTLLVAGLPGFRKLVGFYSSR